MVDVQSTIGQLIPKGTGSGMMSSLSYLMILVLFIGVVGIAIFYIIKQLKFNKKIVIFEKINGRFEPSIKDKAMVVRYGQAGDSIFYLKKLKKYIPTPTYQTGRKTFWFFMREDGELINFTTGDFDEQARQLGAQFLDKEMRYARVSLQAKFKERYDKPKFWEKYGAVIINIVAIVIIMVFLWLIVDKGLDMADKLESTTLATEKVIDATSRVLAALENVCTGSGIVQT